MGPVMMRLVVIGAFLLFMGAARAEDATSSTYTFTEAQTKIIAEAALQRREAAAVEWKRWNDLLADIERQAKKARGPYADPELEPEAKK